MLSPPEKTVFLTSTLQNGNLGGLAGANAICQGLANKAGIGGGRTYMAWLSDDATRSPDTLFTKAMVPYVLPNGTMIANDYADLSDGSILSAINVDESGGSHSEHYVSLQVLARRFRFAPTW